MISLATWASFSDRFTGLLAEVEFVELNPFDTWNEGGCAILAMAIVEWLGQGVRAVTVLDNGDPLHIVAEIGWGPFLDGDGLTNDAGLADTWGDGHVDIELYKPAHAKVGQIRVDPRLSSILASAIGMRIPRDEARLALGLPPE
jgi:hypothetical protein